MLNSRLLAGMAAVLLQRGDEECIVGLGARKLAHFLARERLALDVAEEVGEHLEQVRLTGAEEPRYPHAVRVGVVRVFLEQRRNTLRGVVGEDVFLDLDAQVVGVVGLDDALDRAGDVFEEDLVISSGHASWSRMRLAR